MEIKVASTISEECALFRLPDVLLQEVLSYLNHYCILPFALTSKASLSAVKAKCLIYWAREDVLADRGSIHTKKACFLQSSALCEYGRDVMGLVMYPSLDMMHIAAKSGELEGIKWLRIQGCGWDRETTIHCARNCHLSVLQWMRNQSPPCPMDFTTICTEAIRSTMGGDFSTLKWLYAQGCTVNQGTMDAAARLGLLDTMKWLRSLDPPCPWDDEVFRDAAVCIWWNPSLEILNWLHTQGCPWDVSKCLISSSAAGNLAAIQWILSLEDAPQPITPITLMEMVFRAARMQLRQRSDRPDIDFNIIRTTDDIPENVPPGDVRRAYYSAVLFYSRRRRTLRWLKEMQPPCPGAHLFDFEGNFIGNPDQTQLFLDVLMPNPLP